MDRSQHYANLDPILTGTVKTHLVRQLWDETVRVIASIHDRIVSASLILHVQLFVGLAQRCRCLEYAGASATNGSTSPAPLLPNTQFPWLSFVVLQGPFFLTSWSVQPQAPFCAVTW